jgi:hypothetical protein
VLSARTDKSIYRGPKPASEVHIRVALPIFLTRPQASGIEGEYSEGVESGACIESRSRP